MTKEEAVEVAFRELKAFLAPNVAWYILTEEKVKRILNDLVEAVSAN